MSVGPAAIQSPNNLTHKRPYRTVRVDVNIIEKNVQAKVVRANRFDQPYPLRFMYAQRRGRALPVCRRGMYGGVPGEALVQVWGVVAGEEEEEEKF